MSLTRWTIVVGLVIAFAIYWVWETKREKLSAEISSEPSKEIDFQLTETSNEPTSGPASNSNQETLDIKDLIHAQNRTTHAIRAFVRFIFIQLTGITLAVFLWNLSAAFTDPQKCLIDGSNCNGNTFLQFLAAAVWIVSVIWSSAVGWQELDKSGIDLESETAGESIDKDSLKQFRSTTKICSCGAVSYQNAKRCGDCGFKFAPTHLLIRSQFQGNLWVVAAISGPQLPKFRM